VGGVTAVSPKVGGDVDRPVVFRGGDGSPLVFVHPVGGDIFCYGELCRALDPGYPIWALPVDQALRTGSPTMEETAAQYLERLERSGRLPGVVCGWSFGGVVAYEMGRRSAASGRPLPVILLDAVLSPRGADRHTEAELVEAFLSDIARSAGREPETCFTVPDRFDDWPTEAVSWLGTLGIELHLSPAALAQRGRTFVNSLQALRRYQPEPTDGPVDLVVADADPGQWSRLVHPGAFRITRISSDHYSLLRTPAVKAVAELVDDVVSRQR
jgi:thioesterase domain-containing protein